VAPLLPADLPVLSHLPRPSRPQDLADLARLLVPVDLPLLSHQPVRLLLSRPWLPLLQPVLVDLPPLSRRPVRLLLPHPWLLLVPLVLVHLLDPLAPSDLVVPPDLEVREVPVTRCKPDRAGYRSSRVDACRYQPWQG